MQIRPYLNFDGQCREAFEFYARSLGGTIQMMMTHADSPMKDRTPADWQDKIMHVHMTLPGGAALMGSDMPPGERVGSPAIWVSVDVDSPAEAERVFAVLSEGGAVRMPMERTFWGLFGMTVDRYGKPWMVNCGAAAS